MAVFVVVVLAAAVVTKSGKAVISRQFREMQRSRIEGLLASFPKLTSSGHQHTTVETENVRYVYQPLEDLFMVLITNRQSNILQDIESLHLFARVVGDLCRSLDEREVTRNGFELMSAFDEIISEGYRENVNLSQVKSIIEMESHEEKIQEIIARNKEQEAKEESKRRMKQLEMQRREAQKRGQQYMGSNFSPSYNAPRSPAPFPETTTPVREDRMAFNSSPVPGSSSKAKGMQLGRKTKGADLLESMKSEMGALEEQAAAASPALSSPAFNQTPQPSIPTESVHVQVIERMAVVVNRDGGLEHMEVKGDVKMKIDSADKARIRLLVNHADDEAIQFQTHPNVDKALFRKNSIIALKDSSKPFPVNQPQPLGVLRWRFLGRDETSVPLSITCWPTPTGDGSCDVNVEYELENKNMELKDVTISIPIPQGTQPIVGDIDGTYSFDPHHSTLNWQIPVIDETYSTGSLAFSTPGEDADAYFPVVLNFISDKTFCEVDISDIQAIDSGESLTYSKEVNLLPEDYSVV
ncbi:hypothetical protein BZG36_00895 [Bifiguratus adelaidae]|uniref:Coatomer subunit delta n=1 Tax=Bifiguratus adelaidae TaxID=1938954 RepID=A0A261Y5J7_9FUNG|nr:hypothetical protein BZG36_00895 [Bifiguratus adelaidae]